MFTIEHLKSKAPAVFRTADQGAKSGVSDKYLFIPTVDIIDDLSKLGWDIHDVAQQKSKTSPDTTRHLVRFRNKEFGAVGMNGNIPEILFTNSHDRTKSMTFHVGLFRLICSNGLVIADKTFGKLNLKHNTVMGYSFEDVREMITGVTETLPTVFDKIKSFEQTELNESQAVELAIQAFAARYTEYNKDGNLDRSGIVSSVDINKLLIPYRAEDAPNNLWTVYNRVQEKIMGGDFKHVGSDGILRQARPIKNIMLNLSINERLWEVAEQFA